MNIDSELIKNKRFEDAISDELVKVSQEYRVLAVLRYIFPGKYEQMKHGDKPDLQDKINRIGIEVTAAVQGNDMKANRIFAEMSKNSSDSQRFTTKKITECGYEINSTTGLMSISKYGISDSEKTCLHNGIINKCKKADKYKENYTKIGLAVLLPEIPTSYAEDHIIDWIKEIHSEIESSFDFIYVISSRFCIIYDIKNDYMDKKHLKRVDNQLLCTIARMTAEGELTLDNFEWK